MRSTTVAAAALVVLRCPATEPESVHTLLQQDPWRTPLDASSASLSTDGRYIAFTSYARLVPADTNSQRDVYVLDRLAGQVTLESVSTDGRASPVDSGPAQISGDGRVLVYETAVPTLAGSPQAEIMLRDRHDGRATLVSVTPRMERANGSSVDPDISTDASVVVFSSTATNLVEGGDANGHAFDVYAYELADGRIRRVSLDAAGRQPPLGWSNAPTVSGDGRRVAFASTARLADARPGFAQQGSAPNAIPNVYVRDRERQLTTQVSVGLGGRLADGGSWAPAISADGRTVAFVSVAGNLVREDRNRSADVFPADLDLASVEVISRRADGRAANGQSSLPALSGDGRFVVFQSEASDVLCARSCRAASEDINLLWDVFLFDRERRVTTRVSGDPIGGWLAPSTGAAIDDGGEVIVFSSLHPTEPADLRNDYDLFIVSRRR